jgi:hypothetical protein
MVSLSRAGRLDAIQRQRAAGRRPLGDFTGARAESDPARLGPADLVVLAVKMRQCHRDSDGSIARRPARWC